MAQVVEHLCSKHEALSSNCQKNYSCKLNVVEYTCNPSTLEAQAGGL
jgi:hypothetical protein